MSRTCAAERGATSPVEGSIRARFFAMMRSKFGGLGGKPVMSRVTKASTPSARSAGLKRRSKPMVEAVLLDMARPHVDPAP